MNVTLHAVAAFATGTALAARMPERQPPRLLDRRDLPWLAAGLAGNVALHAAMDLVPHTYPLPWRIDIAASVALMVLSLAAFRPRYVPLLATAFLGGLLPDLVDQGPGLLNRLLGLDLPTGEFFGFHTARYVITGYLGHVELFSVLSHLLVLGGCAALVVGARRKSPLLLRRRR